MCTEVPTTRAKPPKTGALLSHLYSGPLVFFTDQPPQDSCLFLLDHIPTVYLTGTAPSKKNYIFGTQPRVQKGHVCESVLDFSHIPLDCFQ